jgi:hypothetical protein
MLWRIDTWNTPRSRAPDSWPAKTMVSTFVVSPGMNPAMPTTRNTIPTIIATFCTAVSA